MGSYRIKGIAFAFLAALSLIGSGLPLFVSTPVHAAEFSSRQIQLSDNFTGRTATYKLSFSGQSAGSIQSIRLQLCTNDPFPGQPCTAPAGLNFTTGSLVSQAGMTGFSVSGSSTPNQLILTRANPLATISGQVSYELSGVRNPSAPGTVYGRLETFASSDATGPSNDAAGLAVAYLDNALNVQSYVPPYLLFCVANTIQSQDCATAQGNYIDFGELSANRTATGQTQFVVATNADYGFTVGAQGTTLTSGINTIPALSVGGSSRAGTSQFGLNLRANSQPSVGQEPQSLGLSAVISPGYNQANTYKFVSGDVLVTANDPDMGKYTVSYIANVVRGQPPGIYVSTITYVALASF